MRPLLLTLMCSTAFARETDPPDELNIVNGKEEKGYPSAVAIGFEAGGFRQSTCSASLITPRLLLTAAHCSAEFGIPLDQIEQFGVVFLGHDVQRADTVPFKQITNHPQYEGITNGGTPENDVSVIELEEDILDIEPVWFNTEALTNDVIGEKIVSVGYGVTDGATQQGGGIKRSARLNISGLEEQFITVAHADNNANANICSGDSGGPQYHESEDGTLVQWSVHSWADQYCRFLSGSTRTDLMADWILKQVDKAHGTTDVCTINGLYANGVCDEVCTWVDPDCIEGGSGSSGGGGQSALKGCNTTPSRPGAPLAAAAALALVALRRRR